MTAQAGQTLIRDRRRHTFLASLPLIALMLAAAPIAQPRGVDELLEVVGCVLLLACVLGRTWCSLYISGRKKREIVGDGPYSVVRNPLYLFSLFGVIGIGMLSGMLTVACTLPLIFLLYYRAVIRREEAYLAGQFGDAFLAYARRVPRWLPDLSLWHDRPEMVIRPRLVMITMRDSAIFFAALPAFELIKLLHEGGAVPAFLTLP